MKTLKELKQDLLSDTPRTKKVVPPPPDSVEIERRLLEETIEEIAGFRSQEEEAEEAVPAVAEQSLNLWDVDIEAEMKKHGLPFEVRFRGEEDPSMHRNAASSLNIEPLGDFGEASLRDVAQSGHFEGDRGRALYESLKTRDNSTPARISEIARGRLAQSTPLQLISQQIVPDIEITPAAEDLELPPVDKTAEPLVAEPTEPAQPTETRPSASTSRVSDYFLKLAIEADLKKKAQSKPRRKPRRKQRAQSPVEEGEDEFTEMNRPLIRHKRRPRATRQHKPAVRMMPMFDIFDGLDEYEPDREKVSEEPVVERAQTVAKPDAMPSAEISISAAVQDIAQISDIIPQAPEDLASILGFEQPTTTQKERDQATPVSDAFVSKRPRIETSLEQPRISMLRATDEGTRSRITADDVEFSELQAISEQAKAKERGEKTPIPMILREAVEATEALRAKKAPPAEPALEDEPVLFRIVDGPIEKMVEFVGVNGTIERHTEYSMDVSVDLALVNLTNLLNTFFYLDNDVLLPNPLFYEATSIVEHEMG